MTTPAIKPATLALHADLFRVMTEHSRNVSVQDAVEVLASLASFTVMHCTGPSGIDGMEFIFAKAVEAARRQYQ